MVGSALDTIVACATPWGRSAIALLRLSGPNALLLCRDLCPGGPVWTPRRATVRHAMDNDRVLDRVVITHMPAPNTYTGEDIVEIGCHGNPVIVEAIIDCLVRRGARPARPGEFTRRAVEHGRMNLLQAEAVAGVIDATSTQGVRLAQAALGGSVEKHVAALREKGLDLAAELEARLDHPDDDLSRESDDAVIAALYRLAEQAEKLAQGWVAGRMCLFGAKVGIVGDVNAGKSSLFNRLVGRERALVSDRPGTTRDVVEQTIQIDGISVTFLDTAGERATQDELERAGIALGRSLTASVDLLLIVLPLHRSPSDVTRALLARTEGSPRLLVGTYLDQCEVAQIPVDHAVSNVDGRGLKGLLAGLRKKVTHEASTGVTTMLLSQRQHALFLASSVCFRAAGAALAGIEGTAVAAEEVMRGLEGLGELEGRDVREDVLVRLFSKFCIGK
jgi:tRNA modification GTPase